MLITGSSGQLGSYLVAGQQGLDRRPGEGTTFVQDVREPLPAARMIVHCAAQVSVEASLLDPRDDAAHNIDGTLSILEHARKTDARVLLVSSAAVYGQPDATPIPETHPAEPTSPYGLSKWTAERYGMLYRNLYGLPVTVVRPFNLYSPRMDLENQYAGVLGRFIHRVRDGKLPRIEGDGEQTRDLVDARDVADAIIHLLDGGHEGVYNVGTGLGTSVNEVARLVMAAAGMEGAPERAPPRQGDIRHSIADVSKLEATGHRCERRLADGVQELWDAAVATRR